MVVVGAATAVAAEAVVAVAVAGVVAIIAIINRTFVNFFSSCPFSS